MQHKKQTLIFPVQGLLVFWTAAHNAATEWFAAQFCRDANKTGRRTDGLRASPTWSRAEGSSGPAVPRYWHTTSPLGDTRGLPPIPPRQPFQHRKRWRWHRPSCASRGAAAVKNASRVLLPARRHQSQPRHAHRDPVRPTENGREDESTALMEYSCPG